MSQPKITAEHELVRAKIAAGLTPADALICAQRQIDHDDALEAAAEKAAIDAEKAAKKAALAAKKAAAEAS